MWELLNNHQQESTKQQLVNFLSTLAANNSMTPYAILEPPQNEQIGEIFLTTGVKYEDILQPLDDAFEDIGPRLVELGQSEEFDEWFIEQAFLNHWSAIWVSQYDSHVIATHLSHLIYQSDDSGKPIIFRAYSPLSLIEWIKGLNSLARNSNTYQPFEALGIFNDVYVTSEIPQTVIHYYFDDREQLLNSEIPISSIVSLPPNAITSETVFPILYNWALSEQEYSYLANVREHHLFFAVRKTVIQRLDLLTHYSVEDLNKIVHNVMEKCITFNIMKLYYREVLAILFCNHQSLWERVINEELLMLSDELLKEGDKVERIAVLLDEYEKQRNE